VLLRDVLACSSDGPILHDLVPPKGTIKVATFVDSYNGTCNFHDIAPSYLNNLARKVPLGTIYCPICKEALK